MRAKEMIRMFGRAKDDSGFALIAVMGAIALITVVAIAGYFVASQSLTDSSRSSDEEMAYQIASTGLERAYNTFDSSQAGSTQPWSALNGGQYQITMNGKVQDPSLNNSEYWLISVGKYGNAQETVKVKFTDWNLWNMNIAGAAGSNMNGASGNSGFNGQSVVTGPFYTKGSFKVGSGATSYYDFSGGPLYVYNGDVTDWGGTSGPGDLYINTVPSAGYPSGVSIHNNPPDIELPWIDSAKETSYYTSATAQSTDNKLGDSSVAVTEPASYPAVLAPGANTAKYKYVGPAGGPAGLAAGATGLTLGSTSFGRFPGNGYPATSTAHDDFAYNGSTSPGQLWVEGTVFVDGPLTTSKSITYNGNGTLFVNGKVAFGGDFVPPGTSPGTIDASHCVGIVTPWASSGGNSDPAVDVGGNTVHCAIFTNGLLGLQHGGTFVGAALTGGIAAIGSGATHITVTLDNAVHDNLPKGMPASNTSIRNREVWLRQ